MARTGRPRKPVAELRLAGTYRRDRHAGREPFRLTPGEPPMPAWLTDPAARALWRSLAPGLFNSGLACQEDAAALALCCRWFGLWQAADRAYRTARSPTKREFHFRAAKDASAEAQRLLAKFGLTPADRAAIKLDAPAKPDAAEFDLNPPSA